MEAVSIASEITRSIDCDVFICSKWNEQTFDRVRVLGWNGEFMLVRGGFSKFLKEIFHNDPQWSVTRLIILSDKPHCAFFCAKKNIESSRPL